MAGVMLVIAALVAGCSISSQQTSAEKRSQAAAATDAKTPASQYVAIAMVGNEQLEIDFDQLSGPDRDRLNNAHADLSDASATERLFDRRLLMIAFPSAVKTVAEEPVHGERISR